MDSTTLIYLIFAIVLIVLLVLFLLSRGRENTSRQLNSQLIQERNGLKTELQDLAKQMDVAKTQKASLGAEVAAVRTELLAAKNEKSQLDQQNQTFSSLLEEERVTNKKQSVQIAELVKDLKNIQERLGEQKDNDERLNSQFEALANKIIDDKTKKFDIQHKEGIREVLEPLKERIKHFETKVENTHKDNIERHSSLKEQITNLMETNEKVKMEANNLTKALKGDSKQQGNWGELILESVLDKSGLEKDREYFTQQSMDGPEGKKVQPDVIIHLPDNKRLVIDSKVSLTAYERFVNAEEQDEQRNEVKAHCLSVRRHIDQLSAKKYHDIYQMESPDFVLMFVPIETALAAALKAEDSLYEYAFAKNIVLVTPSTLLATLKTIDTLWQNYKHNKNALQIAVEAGKMYDKIVGFVTDLEKVGTRIGQLQNDYDSSMKKLSTGGGNILGKAQKIKKMGAKASKDLPAVYLENQEELLSIEDGE